MATSNDELTMRDIAHKGHEAQRAKYGDNYRSILGKRGGEAFNRKYIADPRYGRVNSDFVNAPITVHDNTDDEIPL